MGAASFWVIGTLLFYNPIFLFYCPAFAHIPLSQVLAPCCRWGCAPFAGFALAPSPRTRMSFRGFAPVGVIRLLRDLSYFGNRFIEKQKSRHFCNFFAIRDSFLFLQSGNRLPNGRLPAFLHRNPRSGEPITIPNRKKVAIRADFLFSVPLPTVLGWCRGRGDPSPALRDGPGVARVHAAE